MAKHKITKDDIFQELTQIVLTKLTHISESYDDDNMVEVATDVELSPDEKEKLSMYVAKKGWLIEYYGRTVTQKSVSGHATRGFLLDCNKYTREALGKLQMSRLIIIAQFKGNVIEKTTQLTKDEVIDLLMGKTKRATISFGKAARDIKDSATLIMETNKVIADVRLKEARHVGKVLDGQIMEQIIPGFTHVRDLMELNKLKVKSSGQLITEMKVVGDPPYYEFKTEQGKVHGYFPNVLKRYVEGLE